MLLRSQIATFSLLMLVSSLRAPAQEWNEAQVIERFLQQSPQPRELRARVAIAQAEARGRALYPNPSFSYSREGAGFNEFFEVGQTLPISGRLGYLRQAGRDQRCVVDRCAAGVVSKAAHTFRATSGLTDR